MRRESRQVAFRSPARDLYVYRARTQRFLLLVVPRGEQGEQGQRWYTGRAMCAGRARRIHANIRPTHVSEPRTPGTRPSSADINTVQALPLRLTHRTPPRVPPLMLWGALIPSLAAFKLAKGTPAESKAPPTSRPRTAFDIQAHRGGRGDVVENTLPAFAWALIHGATTLELDNGITKDGVVIVWHDESIVPEKCKDTLPAFPGDPDFPYVGKLVADLTLDQIKTLDCGTNRLEDYPLQATYPGTRISTLQEFFDFVGCADPTHEILMNIESKIDAEFPNRTKSVDEFVWRQHALFSASAYAGAITYQSFDWRTLVGMKARDPAIKVSGLVDDDTLYEPGVRSPWFAGRDVDTYPGATRGVRLAQMAAALGLDILSPIATSLKSPTREPHEPAYVPFTTEEMIREGHRLGLAVKPWTVNRLNVADRLVTWGVDGLITDYPDATRRWAKGRGMPIAPRYPSSRVLACLAKHNQVATPVLAAAPPPPSSRVHSSEL